jgi:hypothetical protein
MANLSGPLTHAVGVARKRFWQNLQRYIALELGVTSAIYLAHPAFADRGENLIWAEFRANRERHTQDLVKFIRSGRRYAS